MECNCLLSQYQCKFFFWSTDICIYVMQFYVCKCFVDYIFSLSVTLTVGCPPRWCIPQTQPSVSLGWLVQLQFCWWRTFRYICDLYLSMLDFDFLIIFAYFFFFLFFILCSFSLNASIFSFSLFFYLEIKATHVTVIHNSFRCHLFLISNREGFLMTAKYSVVFADRYGANILKLNFMFCS